MKVYYFAYITLGNDISMFTIANAKDCINDLRKLKKGDVLNIKGIGEIIVEKVHRYSNWGTPTAEQNNYVYDDVEVVCQYPQHLRHHLKV